MARSPHDSMRDGQVCFTLVHHANQYVITDGYADREGLGDILGIRGSSGSPTGLLPLLQNVTLDTVARSAEENAHLILEHLVGRGYVRRDEALHATPPSLAAGAL